MLLLWSHISMFLPILATVALVVLKATQISLLCLKVKAYILEVEE